MIDDTRYVVRKNFREERPTGKAYPWFIYDLQAHEPIAYGQEETIRDWAEQLNTVGYVQLR